MTDKVNTSEEKLATANKLINNLHLSFDEINRAEELCQEASEDSSSEQRAGELLFQIKYNLIESGECGSDVQGQYDALQKEIEVFLNKYPNSIEALFWSGVAQAKFAEKAGAMSALATIQKSLKTFAKAAKLEPMHPFSVLSLSAMAEVYCESPFPVKNMRKGKKLSQEAIEKDPNSTFSALIRGKVHARLDEFSEARKMFDYCLSIDKPTFPADAHLTDWPDAKICLESLPA